MLGWCYRQHWIVFSVCYGQCWVALPSIRLVILQYYSCVMRHIIWYNTSTFFGQLSPKMILYLMHILCYGFKVLIPFAFKKYVYKIISIKETCLWKCKIYWLFPWSSPLLYWSCHFLPSRHGTKKPCYLLWDTGDWTYKNHYRTRCIEAWHGMTNSGEVH